MSHDTLVVCLIINIVAVLVGGGSMLSSEKSGGGAITIFLVGLVLCCVFGVKLAQYYIS